LSASGGFESAITADLLNWSSRVRPIGASASETIFDFGSRADTVAKSRAAYDRTIAQYRQAVLTAFQRLEDNLTSLRILNQEIRQPDAAAKSSAYYFDLPKECCKLGIDSYLNVITAQTTPPVNRQTSVNLRMQQMTATVQLIEVLGVWKTGQLPAHL
jgi:outer membrane protein TolC